MGDIVSINCRILSSHTTKVGANDTGYARVGTMTGLAVSARDKDSLIISHHHGRLTHDDALCLIAQM
jgi:hypothetical protein